MSYRDNLEGLAHRVEALAQEAARTDEELAEARRLLEQARIRARMPVLDNLQVAAPCKADWNKMVGDEHARFCGQCEKNVYNLSSLTRAAAEALLIEKEGKLCVRYYQRADGTILTADCPDGVARRRRRVRIIAASFGAMSAVAAALSALQPRAPLMGAVRPVAMTGELPSPRNVGVPIDEDAPRNIGVPADRNIAVMGGPLPVQGEPAPRPTPAPVKHPVMGKMKMGGAAVPMMGDISPPTSVPR